MVMVVSSTSGYWRTWRLISPCAPSSRIRRLTTIDRTGRRMNSSVKLMAVLPWLCCLLPVREPGRFGLGDVDGVVDLHGGAGLELVLPRGDHLLARLHPRQDLEGAPAAAAGL